ncbi:hypothetical protein PGT21_020239 [Puccinia graminis f. sp. tritici]|uniref:Uncharacterized protein n=2 Tax=Puccinia graminis f. sp. tritici TaxID=56615 RepID=E3KUS3_PUCGT|nr:uncharacterized protein PGTG_13827 [Puccinia graminis f. sp. tritici CRL 75-36-700-3]EFP88023.1 hypothetical protein PGTG_13827 [Puccinia graminis f. sp. tritici CRL 75-36-700-3]KAA1108656.1 hypothetical protein PGT21_020239 [Puccinia graminis f. sp. tritici]
MHCSVLLVVLLAAVTIARPDGDGLQRFNQDVRVGHGAGRGRGRRALIPLDIGSDVQKSNEGTPLGSLASSLMSSGDSVKPDFEEAASEQYRPSARPMHLSGQPEADSRSAIGDMGGMIGKRDGIFPSFASDGNRNKMGLDSLEGITGLGDQLMGLGGSRALNGLGDSAMSQGRPRGTDGYEDSMAANDPSPRKSSLAKYGSHSGIPDSSNDDSGYGSGEGQGSGL